jgi:histone acetyltransferase (RNA polymerase elongator complex component)
MATYFVIPVFIAHEGCPHQCLFCNQHRITGSSVTSTTAAQVEDEIRSWLSRPRRNPEAVVQVAFYGGSFTGLSLHLQEELLGAVQPFIKAGQVREIRLSTRPDYIDGPTVEFLKKYQVRLVELGVQSLDDSVLEASGRGHSAAQSEEAVRILRSAGLDVGIQLMIGLPGDTTARALATVRRTVALAPDLVRIYPTLVIEESPLAAMYDQGRFLPMSMNRAVALAARMKGIFEQSGVVVARIGLQPASSLEEGLVAGPYHPAFGELVLSRLLFNQVRRVLAGDPDRKQKRLVIAGADQSVFRGKGNCNIRRLTALGLLAEVEIVFDKQQPRQTVVLQDVS